MTKIKLCGLSRQCDINWANILKPEYIGFVFAEKSRRFVSADTAKGLKSGLNSEIKAVGVFQDETPERIADLLSCGVIDIAQLHGAETEEYINKLRSLTDKPIIKAFRIASPADIADAQNSSADFVLLDSGGGTGRGFDWNLAKSIKRPYFLAGGLSPDNVKLAIKLLAPFAVDVSSGVETDKVKDLQKMTEFIRTVRGATERK